MGRQYLLSQSACLISDSLFGLLFTFHSNNQIANRQSTSFKPKLNLRCQALSIFNIIMTQPSIRNILSALLVTILSCRRMQNKTKKEHNTDCIPVDELKKNQVCQIKVIPKQNIELATSRSVGILTEMFGSEVNVDHHLADTKIQFVIANKNRSWQAKDMFGNSIMLNGVGDSAGVFRYQKDSVHIRDINSERSLLQYISSFPVVLAASLLKINFQAGELSSLRSIKVSLSSVYPVSVLVQFQKGSWRVIRVIRQQSSNLLPFLNLQFLYNLFFAFAGISYLIYSFKEIFDSFNEEGIKQTDYQDTQCIVCCKNERNVVFQPCRHLIVCGICFGQLMKRNQIKQCLVCKTIITRINKLVQI